MLSSSRTSGQKIQTNSGILTTRQLTGNFCSVNFKVRTPSIVALDYCKDRSCMRVQSELFDVLKNDYLANRTEDLVH